MHNIKKEFLFLLIIIIVGIIMGFLFPNILNINDQNLVTLKITNYFTNLKNNADIDYLNNLLQIIKNNLFYLLIIWTMGISVIGLLFNNFLLFFKSFIIGFTMGSIINVYLYSGIVLACISAIPLIISLFIFSTMIYYANIFSIRIFKVLFLHQEYHFKVFFQKYLKILGILGTILFFNSLLETFFIPFLIKIFGFLIK